MQPLFNSFTARLISSALIMLLMSACSSNIQPEISQPMEGAPGLQQVLKQPEAYLSQKVRWGGVILEIENQQQTTRLTIVAFPLDNNGRPKLPALSPGRFIAVVDKFLEPVVYKTDREITFAGAILKTETRNVGEFPYTYPVIQAQHYHLWPERSDSEINNNYRPYWWYDPWYAPCYKGRPCYPRRIH